MKLRFLESQPPRTPEALLAKERCQTSRMDLKALYLETLERCSPEILIQPYVYPSLPHNVVALGKCAGSMLDGVAARHQVDRAFVAMPAGYRPPRTAAELHIGGHPQMTPASFAAGRALLEFVNRHEDVLFLVSGGGSACAEVPLAPWTDGEVAEANARLVESGLPIGEINAQRKRTSAIKGGRLADHVRGRCVTLLYSDVATGAMEDIASGPTITPGCEATVIADNTTLTQTAATIADSIATRIESQIESDVTTAALQLAEHARALPPGGILVAGGEPTVAVRGRGKGGRCSELALRFAIEWNRDSVYPVAALFGSSDGIDGNSRVAGILLKRLPVALDPGMAVRALEESDSYRVAAEIGSPIVIAPTGNNLRDLFLVARD